MPNPDSLHSRLTAPSPRLRAILAGAALVLFCMVAYGPALQGKFLWDDLYLVGTNPFFKSPRFVFEVFRHYLFDQSISVYYRPVQNLTYMIDYALWNRDEFGYHLANVLYHAAASVLLWLTLRRCLRAIYPGGAGEGVAWAVAAFWAVLPVHNAAVAYIAGRADSLAMMFALAGWLLLTGNGRGWRAVVAACGGAFCFLLALCSKEIAGVWLLLFLVWLFGFEKKRPIFARVGIAVILAAVLGVYLWLRHLPGIHTPPPPEAKAFGARLLLVFRALGQYTALIFWPAHLHMERTLPPGLGHTGIAAWLDAVRGDWLLLLGLLTAAAGVFACAVRLPGRAVRAFGVVWFALGFLPISNLFPLNADVAEHWIYMASAGYLLAIFGILIALPAAAWRGLAFVLPAAFVALTLRTASRAAEWTDPEAFYLQTISDGGAPDRVLVNLANLHSDRGDLKGAEAVFRDVLRRYPGFASAQLGLGRILVAEGNAPAAQKALTIAPAAEKHLSAYVPDTWTAALNLAHSQYNAKQTGVALATLDAALQRHPGIWDVIYFRAQILWLTRGAATALPAVRDFAAAHWWHYDSHRMLGQLQAASGDYAGAMATLRDAATLDIHNTAPYDDMARYAVRAGRMDDALAAQQAGVNRAPDEPHEDKLLAAILRKLNRPAEAAAALQRAAALSGGLPGPQ
ncbi:MAG TPA: tetratricopeptide repeat protein [Chthoniobacteraceae bacterium]|nr:tetratricopeptide repeat protein [Chthoniobacteraceae bacterium]